MSLLHDALKKAEQGKGASEGGEAFVDGGVEEKKSSPVRIYILVSLVVSGLLFIGYQQLFRGHNQEQSLAPAGELTTPLGIAGGPGASALAQEADGYLRSEQWAEAQKVLEKWVILEPRNAEAYNNLGLAYKKLGKKDQAYEQYNKALAILPDFPEALNNLGALYLVDRKLIDAEVRLQQAITLKPDFAEPYFHLALIAEAQGKGAAAKNNYQKFLELSPGLEAGFITEIRNRMEELNRSG